MESYTEKKNSIKYELTEYTSSSTATTTIKHKWDGSYGMNDGKQYDATEQ